MPPVNQRAKGCCHSKTVVHFSNQESSDDGKFAPEFGRIGARPIVESVILLERLDMGAGGKLGRRGIDGHFGHRDSILAQATWG